jgi:hypothetical protein
MLVFLHHLKTGGTTLRAILGRQYPPAAIHNTAGRPMEAVQLKGLRRMDPDLIRVVQGHIPFGVHAYLPRPAKYITLLRHPVERIASLYHHVLEEPGRDIHEELLPHLASIEEFVQSGASLEVDNGQTRRLSGSSPPFGQCTLEMLESAKRHLREHFVVVGLTERFDETLVLFRRLLGWRGVFYHRRQKTTDRPRGPLAPETLRVLERHNRLDLELHAYAEMLFEEFLSAADADFHDEVTTLRAVNDALSRQGDARRALQSDAVWTLADADPTTGLPLTLLDAYAACLAHDRTLQWENARLRRTLSKLEKRASREALR